MPSISPRCLLFQARWKVNPAIFVKMSILSGSTPMKKPTPGRDSSRALTPKYSSEVPANSRIAFSSRTAFFFEGSTRMSRSPVARTCPWWASAYAPTTRYLTSAADSAISRSRMSCSATVCVEASAQGSKGGDALGRRQARQCDGAGALFRVRPVVGRTKSPTFDRRSSSSDASRALLLPHIESLAPSEG